MRTFSRFTATDGNRMLVDVSIIVSVVDKGQFRTIFTPFDEIDVYETLEELDIILNQYKLFMANSLRN
jgi:hypothetical protein